MLLGSKTRSIFAQSGLAVCETRQEANELTREHYNLVGFSVRFEDTYEVHMHTGVADLL